MSIDKFGRHISDYYNNDDNNCDLKLAHSLYYIHVLTFQSKTVHPESKKYLLNNELEPNYQLLFDSGIVINVHNHPDGVITVINDKEYTPSQLVNVKLMKNDKISFREKDQASNVKKLFIELALKVPIILEQNDVLIKAKNFDL